MRLDAPTLLVSMVCIVLLGNSFTLFFVGVAGLSAEHWRGDIDDDGGVEECSKILHL